MKPKSDLAVATTGAWTYRWLNKFIRQSIFEPDTYIIEGCNYTLSGREAGKEVLNEALASVTRRDYSSFDYFVSRVWAERTSICIRSSSSDDCARTSGNTDNGTSHANAGTIPNNRRRISG